MKSHYKFAEKAQPFPLPILSAPRLHPLMTIIQPDRAADWGKVLVQGYKEGGILPKWPLASSYTGCMVGYPAVSVLADLVTKDLAEGDLNVWAEAGARSSVYRNDLAEKFKGTRELI